MGRMVLNHCHVMPEDMKDLPCPGWGSVAGALDIMRAVGAVKTIAFAPFVQQVVQDPNEWLVNVMKGRKELAGFATISPVEKQAADKLEDFIEKGMCGAKVHPAMMEFKINDPCARAFYSIAERLRVPILIHTGVHSWRLADCAPILIDEVAQEHPNLNIIIEHTGGTHFFLQALAVLENGHPNTFAGLTSTISEESPWHLSRDQILLILRRVGSERVIYGTDYPYRTLEVIRNDISFIDGLPISSGDKDNILGGNIERLIGQVGD